MVCFSSVFVQGRPLLEVFFSMQNYLVNSYLYHIGNKLREFIAFFMNSNETKKGQDFFYLVYEWPL